jgi:hypothetical protein
MVEAGFLCSGVVVSQQTVCSCCGGRWQGGVLKHWHLPCVASFAGIGGQQEQQANGTLLQSSGAGSTQQQQQQQAGRSSSRLSQPHDRQGSTPPKQHNSSAPATLLDVEQQPGVKSLLALVQAEKLGSKEAAAAWADVQVVPTLLQVRMRAAMHSCLQPRALLMWRSTTSTLKFKNAAFCLTVVSMLKSNPTTFLLVLLSS